MILKYRRFILRIFSLYECTMKYWYESGWMRSIKYIFCSYIHRFEVFCENLWTSSLAYYGKWLKHCDSQIDEISASTRSARIYLGRLIKTNMILITGRYFWMMIASGFYLFAYKGLWRSFPLSFFFEAEQILYLYI